MKLVSNILTGIVALSHIWFMVLEMFLWNTATGHKTFKLTPEFAEASAALAANQGLYNGFLAAGLIWAIASKRNDLKIFFLTCVLVAGVFGAVTVGSSILYVQALPALAALAVLMISKKISSEV